jgi:hypothetical protein
MSEAVIEVKGRSTSAESSLLNSSENIREDFYNLMQVSLFEIAWFSHRQGQRTKDYVKIWGGKLGSSLNSLTVARGGTSKLSVNGYLIKAWSLERAAESAQQGVGELGDGNSAARFNIAARLLLHYAKEVRQTLLAIVLGMLLSSSAFAQQTHSLDVKVGQRIKLRDMGGPNVQLIVNGVDQFDVSVTLIDYEHMRFVRTNGTYGYQQPGITNEQFKIADRGGTRIFHRGDCSVYYVPDMNTRMNHAKVEVKVGS